jgi:hypothetical protein
LIKFFILLEFLFPEDEQAIRKTSETNRNVPLNFFLVAIFISASYKLIIIMNNNVSKYFISD